MVVGQDTSAGQVTITGFGGSDTGNDGTGMFDSTLTDGENPFSGTDVSGSGGGSSGGSSGGFGDGSNEWIPGIQETVANPADRITSPFETVAGAADAAALNFDEGVGGLASFFDNQPGNTAGPGDSAAFDPDGDGRASLQEQLRALGDAAEKTVRNVSPVAAWVANNQMAVAVGIVILLALFATEGTVGIAGEGAA